MKSTLRHCFGQVLALLWLSVTGISAMAAPIIPDRDDPRVQSAMAVQERHTDELMQLPDVVGTGVGTDDTGQPVIVVFTRRPVAKEELGDNREGVPVVTQMTGEFFAMKITDSTPPTAVANSANTGRFNRPVPIGVSTGNRGECSAGTIGARVKAGKKVYALSNNHVYALENRARIGSQVVQPGLYDTRCAFVSSNVIGTLYAYQKIDFSTRASNTIDAAIALTSTSQLGNATPADGYGAPSNTTAPAQIGQRVQKYGRTTSLTKGTVSAINATILVTYSSGTARFVKQIIVTSGSAFILPGDSGSLLVSDPGRNPVGLLFAGSSDGTLAVANPIGTVLSRLGVAIDGGTRGASAFSEPLIDEGDD